MNRHLPSLLSAAALAVAVSGCKPKVPTAPEAAAASSPAGGSAEVGADAEDARVGRITSRIREIVATQLKLPLSNVSTKSTWKQLGADSLDTVELIMALEEEYHLEIPDARAEAMLTVGDAVKYVTQHTKPATPQP